MDRPAFVCELAGQYRRTIQVESRLGLPQPSQSGSNLDIPLWRLVFH